MKPIKLVCRYCHKQIENDVDVPLLWTHTATSDPFCGKDNLSTFHLADYQGTLSYEQIIERMSR